MKQCLSNFPKWVKARKRGKKCSLRVKLTRRKHKLALPSIMFGNMRSLSKQYRKLLTCVKYLREYRDACALCFNETWLNPDITDSAVELIGFKLFRGDRTSNSGKHHGGGVCVYINNKWCNNYKVLLCSCTENIEVLSILCRPYCLPRELSCAGGSCVFAK